MTVKKFLIWMIAFILLVTTVQGALTDGMMHYWTLDDTDLNGGVYTDVHANSCNATVSGVTTGASGIINEAGDWDTNTDKLDTCDIDTGTGEITVMCWGQADAWDGTDVVMSSLYDGSNTGWEFDIEADVGWSIRIGGTKYEADATRPSAGAWVMYVGVYDGDTVQIYLNTTSAGNNTVPSGAMDDNNAQVYIGEISHTGASAQAFNGRLDECAVWDRDLTYAEIVALHGNISSGSGYNFSGGGGGPGATTDIDFTAVDDWNSTAITSFAVNITWQNGSTESHSTTNGTVSLVDVGNPGTLNVTYWNVTDYWDASLLNEAITVNITNTIQASMYQAVICFDATAKVSGASVTPDNFTIDSTTKTSCFNLTAENHNVQANLNGWFSKNQTFSVSALSNTTLTVENMSYANLTIYAWDGTTNESLSGYDLTILSLNHSGWIGENDTGVTNHTYSLINGTYNVTIDMPGYALTYGQANITVDGNTEYNFTLYKTNSVQIYIWDEITGNPITENVTVRWTSNATTWENVTDTGSLFVSNITADQYELLFYSSNYSTRSYTITVGNRSTQVLNAYMINSEYSTIFTIKDIDTGAILDGVAITMYKQINSTWTTVESKFSDISGKAQFYYDPIAHYRFYLSNTNYEDYIFYLNPILFDEYDVFMTRSSVLNYSVDFDDISVIYSPIQFENEENVSFNFLISSPTGLLTDYGIKLTYPGGSDSATGNNAIGEQLSADVNITGAGVYDYVVLEFNYTTSLAGERNYVVNLPINMNQSGGTWLTNKEQTYGLGIFERMLIATIIILFIVGIATMVGQPLPGVGIGMFVFGFLVFIGFIPLWAILPSMLIGVLFLIWKSGGY